MKIRESGMPEEKMWEGFFDIPKILKEMEINSQIVDLVEIGSGYGTFTLPFSKEISGNLYAFDYEIEMTEILKTKIVENNLKNIIVEKRDILQKGTGLNSNLIDYVVLFNILHNQQPEILLREALRILKIGGKIGILHWRSDISTPRGPSLEIRPKAEQITRIVDNLKFRIYKPPFIIEPYHFGLILQKK